MTEEFDSETATLCRTKAGNGFKVVVNGVWFYASKHQVLELIHGVRTACTFHTIRDDLVVSPVARKWIASEEGETQPDAQNRDGQRG